MHVGRECYVNPRRANLRTAVQREHVTKLLLPRQEPQHTMHLQAALLRGELELSGQVDGLRTQAAAGAVGSLSGAVPRLLQYYAHWSAGQLPPSALCDVPLAAPHSLQAPWAADVSG